MNQSTLHKIGTVTRVAFMRLRFVAVFVVAALVVGYWDNIKNHVDKWTRPSVAPDALAAASDVEYYCAMHPNVVRSEPGNCPICSMPLIKRKKGEQAALPADVLARVQLTPRRIALAGIGTTAVEPRELAREIHAPGVLDYNETTVAQLSARVAGRADELFVQYAGQIVKQGDPVYSLYSPELYAAQREYLLARKRVNELKEDAGAGLRADAAAVYNATMEKLVLWGVRREQLDRMDQEFDTSGKVPSHLTVTSPIAGTVVRKELFEGGYVNVGDRPYTIADLSTLWLQAKIYERDVPLVHLGQQVEIHVEAAPNQTFFGVVAFRAVRIDPRTRTLDARIVVKNQVTADGQLLRPGMFAEAVIKVPLSGVAATMPSASPATRPTLNQKARSFAEALQPYLQVQEMLARDKSAGAGELLKQVVRALEPIRDDPAIHDAYQRLSDAVAKASDGDIETLRTTYKTISAAVIEIGKTAGLPADAPAVRVFRCPMAKADWLQTASKTSNPYYGSGMLTCGAAVEPLPRANPMAAPATRPVTGAGRMLAIPRSAVIDTGGQKIVYVESAPGIFDMRAVEVGPVAGEYYPLLSGLEEGDRVVTAGAFLVDAENRLNPSR